MQAIPMAKRRLHRVIVATLIVAAVMLRSSLEAADNKSSVDRDIEAVIELCAVAAEKQAQGLVAGEAVNVGLLPNSAVGIKRFAEVQRVYYAALRILGRLDEEELSAWKPVLSQVYSQVGWFVYMIQAGPSLDVDGVELIRKAHQLDPENAVALYQLGKIKMDRRESDAEGAMIRYCLEAVRHDPGFPEAWLQLSLYHGRKGDKASKKETDDKFLTTLASYKSELHFFDSGYPAENVHIFMEGGVELERKVYNADSSRFRIKEK